jgi:hypothetical protein
VAKAELKIRERRKTISDFTVTPRLVVNRGKNQGESSKDKEYCQR